MSSISPRFSQGHFSIEHHLLQWHVLCAHRSFKEFCKSPESVPAQEKTLPLQTRSRQITWVKTRQLLARTDVVTVPAATTPWSTKSFRQLCSDDDNDEWWRLRAQMCRHYYGVTWPKQTSEKGGFFSLLIFKIWDVIPVRTTLLKHNLVQFIYYVKMCLLESTSACVVLHIKRSAVSLEHTNTSSLLFI